MALYRHQVVQLNKIDQIHTAMQDILKSVEMPYVPLGRLLRELFTSDIVVIVRFDPLRQEMEIEHATGLFAAAPPLANFKLDAAMAQLTKDRWTTWNTHATWRTPILERYRAQHAVFVPYRDPDRELKGMLCLYRCFDQAYVEDDIAILVDIAARLGDLMMLRDLWDLQKRHVAFLQKMSAMVLKLTASAETEEALWNQLPGFLDRLSEGYWHGAAWRQIDYAGPVGLSIADDGTSLVFQDSQGMFHGYQIEGRLPSFVGAGLQVFCQHVEELASVRALTRRLERLAQTDMLTGIANRYALWEQLRRWVESKSVASVGLALIDIDDFKQVNDQHGHPTGDAVLIHLTAVAQTLLSGGCLSRYGGEEFVWAVPDPSPVWQTLCESLPQYILDRPYYLSDGTSLSLTVSVGMVQTVTANLDDISQLFRAADQALYQAKALGKNRAVRIHSG